MSQVNAQAPVSAPAAAPASNAPASSPAAAPAQGVQGQFVQVDKGRLGKWGGDYHKALSIADRAEAFQEKFGGSLDDIEAYLIQQQQQAAAPDPNAAAGQQQQANPDDAPLTAAQIQKILDERDNKQQIQQQQYQTQQQLNRAITEAQSSRDTATKSILEGVGIKADDKGQLPPHAEMVSGYIERAIDRQIKASLPGYKQGDRNFVWQALQTTQPTPAMIAAAQEEVARVLGGFSATAVSSFAQGQSGTPAQTLGGGAAGRQEPKSAKDMTPQQFRNYTAGLPLNTPA